MSSVNFSGNLFLTIHKLEKQLLTSVYKTIHTGRVKDVDDSCMSMRQPHQDVTFQDILIFTVFGILRRFTACNYVVVVDGHTVISCFQVTTWILVG
ncbi:hypothetical protein AHF37_11899 [Paragonimus kellicotti]|nr:hypothetical protein AHF37_11899 [Paragonimus kellicotti]